MARWQNGYVADCKSVYAGSIPARASIDLGLEPPPSHPVWQTPQSARQEYACPKSWHTLSRAALNQTQRQASNVFSYIANRRSRIGWRIRRYLLGLSFNCSSAA